MLECCRAQGWSSGFSLSLRNRVLDINDSQILCTEADTIFKYLADSAPKLRKCPLHGNLGAVYVTPLAHSIHQMSVTYLSCKTQVLNRCSRESTKLRQSLFNNNNNNSCFLILRARGQVSEGAEALSTAIFRLHFQEEKPSF